MPRVPRFTYANVTSTIALFIALGGVSWAAATLPRGSVGSVQLQNGAVGEKKLSKAVRAKLTAARGAGPTGAAGAKGDAGPVGPVGPVGPAGPAGGPAVISPDSLTGEDIREDTLRGIQAGTHTSAAKTIPTGSNDAVLTAGGVQLTAQCTSSGPSTGITWRVRNVSGAPVRLVLRATSGTTDDVVASTLGDTVAQGYTMAALVGSAGRLFTVQTVPSAGGAPLTITASAITDGSCLVMADATT